MTKEQIQDIRDGMPGIKRGKWIAAGLRPWTGESGREVFDEMRTSVETRGDQAVEEAIVATLEYLQEVGLLHC